MRRGKRPVQGTTKIVNPTKNEALLHYHGSNLLAATVAEVHDAEFRAFVEAKKARNHAEMGRLIPILRERYGKDLERMVKGIRW